MKDAERYDFASNSATTWHEYWDSNLRVYITTASNIWREFAARLFRRRDSAPIDSIAALNRFAATRAAFIAQKTLYGYLKTRMGIRYPLMFDNDVFVDSVNIAKLHVFAACLSDLTIHAVAHALPDETLEDAVRRKIALDCFKAGLADNSDQFVEAFAMGEAVSEFVRRLDETDWRFGAKQRENFTRSPRALMRWAPIAPELKRFDEEIVENSIRFAWRDVRVQLQKRLVATAVVEELRTRGDGA